MKLKGGFYYLLSSIFRRKPSYGEASHTATNQFIFRQASCSCRLFTRSSRQGILC